MVEFFDDLGEIFLSPVDFYNRVKKEKGLMKPFIYYVIAGLIIYLITIVQVAVDYVNNPETAALGMGILLLQLVFFGFVAILSLFISPFITAGITFVGLLIVGVKKMDFENIFKVTSYSQMIALVYTSIILVMSIFMSLFAYNEDVSLFGGIALIALSITMFAVIIAEMIHLLRTIGIGLSLMFNISFWRALFGYLIIPLVFTIIALSFIFIVVIGVLGLISLDSGITGYVPMIDNLL